MSAQAPETIDDLLQRHGPRLSQRVLEEQYRDPFWEERFGARGRHHADEDSDFHLRYLRRALQHDPGVMLRYARWLREVLASRGMCTHHLADNFLRLAQAIDSMGWPGGDEAARVVRAAEAALVYEEPAARAVQQAAPAVVDEVQRQHRERFPGGWAHDSARPRGMREDLLSYVSYLADALAFGSPATLVAHTSWYAGHLERRGTRRSELDAAIELLQGALHRRGIDGAAQSHLEAALAAPTGGSPPEASWNNTPPPEARSTS